jgi:hypothetical protein
MTKESIMSVELARLAVACCHWRWMPGMLCLGRGFRVERDGLLPDLTDAATLGCLLQLVREARQEPWYYPTAQVYGGQVLWLVERPASERQMLHESEAEALVAALEAAP